MTEYISADENNKTKSYDTNETIKHLVEPPLTQNCIDFINENSNNPTEYNEVYKINSNNELFFKDLKIKIDLMSIYEDKYENSENAQNFFMSEKYTKPKFNYHFVIETIQTAYGDNLLFNCRFYNQDCIQYEPRVFDDEITYKNLSVIEQYNFDCFHYYKNNNLYCYDTMTETHKVSKYNSYKNDNKAGLFDYETFCMNHPKSVELTLCVSFDLDIQTSFPINSHPSICIKNWFEKYNCNLTQYIVGLIHEVENNDVSIIKFENSLEKIEADFKENVVYHPHIVMHCLNTFYKKVFDTYVQKQIVCKNDGKEYKIAYGVSNGTFIGFNLNIFLI